MGKKTIKEPFTEDTVIGSQKITAAEFSIFFKKTLGDDYEKNPFACSVIKMSLSHKGKTLKEIIEECNNLAGNKSLKELLAEDRFKIISITDKSFIAAFDKAINEAGYDFGGAITGNKDFLVIVYGKTGTKTRPRPACFHIDNDWNVYLKLYLHKIDDRRKYIENAPAHIKEIFTNNIGKCNGCNFKDGKCKFNCTKTYTIDGHLYNKCYFHLNELKVEDIPGYIDLLSQFYPMKKVKRKK